MSSPGTQPVKVTKQRRKRNSAEDGSGHSGGEEEQPAQSPKKTKSPTKVNSEMKPPSYIPSDTTRKSKAPDSPESTRRREDNEEAAKKAKQKAPISKGHNRSSSSISAVSRPPNSSTPKASPTTKKSPASVSGRSLRSVKRPKAARAGSPDTDNASIAESTMSLSASRIRRTEPERIEYFKNQPECGDFEAHRALCTRCDKWVNLGKAQTYTVKPWEQHRQKCDQKVFEVPVTDEAASASEGGAGQTRSEPERKDMLDADSRADIVEPNRILCKKCRRWVRSATKYDVTNWRKHLDACTGQVPSSRVATAERKIQIHNDPVATSQGPKRVKCNGCDEVVDLEGEGEYNLTSWEAHKAVCEKAQSLLKLKLRSKASSSSIRPSPSVASADGTTAVAESSSSSPQSRGRKRRRDEVDGVPNSPSGTSAAIEERPTKIQRDESYVPPRDEAPGPFGWFLMPFQAFIRGFKESVHSATR